ncbi:winged helix-turn-helix transcriptional regulator [Pseudonocardia abyssalis]|uniref:Helix-turn-helix transcriptional regulator n=1 Tax=Pseudonocardia abyssalis TaxID=2792008 RepID=A0ABS6UZD1_9PSEU|nr:helix-turn-helix domain-containing protein [Pseudonocardia abyssalis]MBW0116192.1 helix-turn-helix transcriptional regulator [Pseudonocardia abyssalis]MBW0137619.1 helix-turn-helix transcriptional regulator [Pseudonocardia abyssalis]
MRSYDDPCGVARALDAVGERWALLVVRDLLLGPKRFSDLAAGLAGMSQNVLAQRLRDLEAQGLVRRRLLGPPSRARVYELTDAGYELEEVVLALARWGSRAPQVARATLTADALALALRTTFDAGAAGDLHARVDLHLGADRFAAEVTAGRIRIGRGESVDPDAVVTIDAAAMQAIVFGGADLPSDVVSGDRELAERFVRAFPRPEPRGASATG